EEFRCPGLGFGRTRRLPTAEPNKVMLSLSVTAPGLGPALLPPLPGVSPPPLEVRESDGLPEPAGDGVDEHFRDVAVLEGGRERFHPPQYRTACLPDGVWRDMG